MANHCFNGISFYGKDLTKIKQMLSEAIEVNKKREGWLPATLDVSKMPYVHYLFDVDVVYDESKDRIFINCWTKWTPPLEELEHICKEAQVSCSCSYDESGNSVYGEFEYDIKSDKATDVSLDEKDTMRVEYDEDNDCYLFDGKPIESDSDAYQEMLDQKIDALKSEAK